VTIITEASGSFIWLREPANNGVAISYLCDRVVFSGRSKYQKIDIVDTRFHGRMLFLDGVGQSAEQDEFIYHEFLVHPVMFSYPEPKSVLIIGGAEGATLREVLRHKTVQRVVMVDIDGELIEICKKFLPQWSAGAFDDPRTELIIGDGRKFAEECREKFDVIIVDLSDPLQDSPAVYLFTKEFYSALKNCLTPNGCMAIQGEGTSPQENILHARMVNTLKAVFPVVKPYMYNLHSFHRPDSHILVTLQEKWEPKEVAQRLRKSGMKLRAITPEILENLFWLPPYLEEAYKREEGHIITDDNPSFEGVYHLEPPEEEH